MSELRLEEQRPQSQRGREIAAAARSFRIQREIEYTRRPECALTLDVYSPGVPSSRSLPCVLAFGLSGWRKNETDYHWDLDKMPPSPTPNLYPPILARNGYVVVVALLRVSAQAKFPAQIHDAKCALRWVCSNAGRIGIDSQRIAVFGASSSGNLASLLALTADFLQLDDPACLPGLSTKVMAVCSLSGLYDFEFYQQDPGDGSLFVDVIPPYLGAGQMLYRPASPTQYVHAGAPPFLLTHGLQDRRVPYSQMPHFAAMLKDKGVPVETLSVDHYAHGAIRGQEPNPRYETVDRAIDRFLARYLDRKL